ncbi:MAG: hypothetical protein ABJA98_10840 [Acidobacteriota bacterium]
MMTTTDTAGRVRNAFRAVAVSILAVRVMLAVSYFRIAALQVIAPVHDHFFPPLLRHPALVIVAFFGPMLMEVLALDRPTGGQMKRAAMVEVAGAAVLLLHQASYFYATWVIVFWAGLFMVWMAWSGAADEERAAAIGPFLAQLIISLFFLGGAAGKWTAGYWSGEVFYDLLFARRSDLVYAQLRAWFSDANVHLIATWFSRSVIVVETSMALVLFLPARLASSVSILAALALWLTSSDLFEVAWPIIGIAAAGRLLAQRHAAHSGHEVG